MYMQRMKAVQPGQASERSHGWPPQNWWNFCGNQNVTEENCKNLQKHFQWGHPMRDFPFIHPDHMGVSKQSHVLQTETKQTSWMTKLANQNKTDII
jgi:hypothetical protein